MFWILSVAGSELRTLSRSKGLTPADHENKLGLGIRV